MNDATRHQGKYREAWHIIKGLEGHEEVSRSTADGKVVWTVVDKVTDDDFKEIRKFEDKKFEERMYSPMKEPAILKDLNYAKGYWYL